MTLPTFEPTRRAFLGSTGAALGAALLAAGPAHARPARAADFAANVASQPMLTPMRGVPDSAEGLATEAPRLLGRWPTALRGRFHRNGPALYERSGERYHHWLDGDGMVQQFAIEGGRVRHRGRLVQTVKLAAEREAGRFRLPAFGTHIPNPLPVGGPDGVNPANINAIEHGGRLLALWEAGSAHVLNPNDLSTEGPLTWREDLKQMPFSAHPKVDAAGHLWNFGTSGKNLVAWHIRPDGSLGNVQFGKLPWAHGMVHDMAVSERWIVLPLPPLKIDFGSPLEGPRQFPLVPGEPLRILVVRKDNIAEQRVFELPPRMVFHVGNAVDEGDGTISFTYVGADDAGFLNHGAVELMAGRVPQWGASGGASRLYRARLHVGGAAAGRVEDERLPVDGDTEFPRMDPRRIGLGGAERARWLVGAASWRKRRAQPSVFFHGVQAVQVESGRVRRFDYGDRVIVEEHIVVPKPGAARETDAWLLGTTFDARRQATVLNLLEFERLEAGPIAQAVLPYVLPLGFHGNFMAG
jgi:carotenoid cleavage dioxygenase